MDFEKIALSNRDYRRLKKSSAKPIAITKDDMLITLDLIEECRTHVPGYAGSPTGMGRITTTGKLYLAYASSREHIRRKEHTHDWLIAIFSTIGGALLSEPLWNIIHRIIDFVCDGS